MTKLTTQTSFSDLQTVNDNMMVSNIAKEYAYNDVIRIKELGEELLNNHILIMDVRLDSGVDGVKYEPLFNRCGTIQSKYLCKDYMDEADDIRRITLRIKNPVIEEIFHLIDWMGPGAEMIHCKDVTVMPWRDLYYYKKERCKDLVSIDSFDYVNNPGVMSIMSYTLEEYKEIHPWIEP